ncbi:NUDIX hydrolase [Desulfomicrobium baculatum]|uniref:NUDIX hydrolase n=1 Tax=Desulfomicrobium baculatum (strain DSM 4028 / VKM B-1378 / X) TaxID=525897 RepID=C7LN19_DESBD|nr:NUDIX hydrolase [Desulfomicrobium baculatum]ACU88789.1 NUDIX hydrolase [Desulfomicrobium baculatum DSM 4028]
MSLETGLEKIYVVDENNLPLAIMASEQVHLQGLKHRGFLLMLTDVKGRLMLRRLSKSHPLYPGRWDIVGCGHIGAKEAAEEAAERHLPPVAADLTGNLRHALTLTEGAGTGNEIVEVFSAGLSSQDTRLLLQDLSFLAVDPDELGALAASYPDQLSPALLTVWNARLHHPDRS